ncbi:protein arginine N-methyltransferase [Puccinia sorghi]|uniref:Protein arginine N-methyltransferase n=1 Tax=Puccinia sorghi TaxID=27349 RepID=A0A0L6VKW2_9BASI|nr:protein arginine N-methyltransferase [Puccinia sorghi]
MLNSLDVHALLGWFDVSFRACHKPVSFSTGPHAKYTHWKQTVFYLKDTLTVVKGDKIEGSISVRPNAKNHRDLDIDISYKYASSLLEGQQQTTSDSLSFKMSVVTDG